MLVKVLLFAFLSTSLIYPVVILQLSPTLQFRYFFATTLANMNMFSYFCGMTNAMDIKKLEKAAFILKTIAHPARLQMVELLNLNESLSVGEICEKTGLEQSLASHHLSNMKLKGILSSRKEGRNVYYTLREKGVLKILECLENCDCNMG